MGDRDTDVLEPVAPAEPIDDVLRAGGVGRAPGGVRPRPAARKVLHAELAASPATVTRFVQEARAVNQINHPNIVDIFDFDALPDGRPFFVMELLQPHDLQQRMDASGRLTVAEVLAIMAPLCEALEAAHRAG